jgi:hypothetical protein
MGQINCKINDELERKFRRVAVDRFEPRRGFLKKALEEAMADWIKNNSRGGKNG